MSTLRALPDPLSLNERVAAEVRAELARQRMTQQDLAGLIGMSQASVSERLRGKTLFTTDDIERVAGALGVHPAALLGGRPDVPQPPTGTTSGYPDVSTSEGYGSSRNPSTGPLVVSVPLSGRAAA